MPEKIYTIITESDKFKFSSSKLVQISPFFEGLMRHDCKETLENEITLSGCSTENFRKIIGLVNDEESLEFSGIEEIEDLLDIANLYQVSKIIKLYLSVALFNNVINRKSFICLHSFSNR